MRTKTVVIISSLLLFSIIYAKADQLDQGKSSPIITKSTISENVVVANTQQAPSSNKAFSESLNSDNGSNNNQSNPSSYKPGELIVKIKEGYTISDINDLNNTYNVTSSDKAFSTYENPKDKIDQLQKKLDDLATGHNSWYWQLDKNSDEYKKYQAKIASEEKGLKDQIDKEKETLARLDAYTEECKANGTSVPNLDQIYVLKLDPSANIQEAENAYKNNPAVEYAHRNYIVKANMVPNDPFWSSSGSWGQSFSDLWGLHIIQADKAWDITQGQGVIVAVSDSGVDYNHPDIVASMWVNPQDSSHGYNFVSNNNNPMDDYGHGTHVAGIIAATGNNNLGIIGVAPKVKIMAVKGLDYTGSGTFDVLAQTIQYAADNGAGVINCSWGGGNIASTGTVVADAISYATNIKNVVVVAAAGNDNQDVDVGEFSPANIKEVITVSATNSSDQKASFSNYGAKIDVAAPGGGDTSPSGNYPERSILSLLSSNATSDMTGSGALVVQNNYLRQAGTSMACPYVSGVAALVRSLNPTFTPEQVRQAIRAGANDILTPGFDTYSGYGRVNALGAVSIHQPIAPKILAPDNVEIDNATNIPIIYTIQGNNVASWSIMYGDTATPTSWSTIVQGTGSVTTQTTFNWNIQNVTDGIKTIRIVALNTNGAAFEDRVVIQNNHVIITKPQDPIFYSYYGPGQNVVIEGTVNPYNLTSYSIEIHKLQEGTDTIVQNAAVTLNNGGTAPVVNGNIATWNTTNVPMGYYVIYLNVYANGTPLISKHIRVAVDPSLHPGWPIRIPAVAWNGGGIIYDVPPVNIFTIADINGDGRDEVLLNYNGRINVIDGNGISLPGWPVNFANFSNTGVTVGDIMGTGKPQVIVPLCN